jgi:hypothetical protein
VAVVGVAETNAADTDELAGVRASPVWKREPGKADGPIPKRRPTYQCLRAEVDANRWTKMRAAFAPTRTTKGMARGNLQLRHGLSPP